MKRQIYVAQPSEKGNYEVAKWSEKEQNYIPIEQNYTEKAARERAHDLNEEEQCC